MPRRPRSASKSESIRRVVHQNVHYHVAGVSVADMVGSGKLQAWLKKHPNYWVSAILVTERAGKKWIGISILDDQPGRPKRGKAGITLDALSGASDKQMSIFVEALKEILK